jgi:tetratricopeptide (TPR) repeat protein
MDAIKSYKRAVEKGVEFLKKVISAKNAKKKISFGLKSVENFKKAINLSSKIGLKKKTPFIHEYLQQVYATLGASYLELEKTKQAIRIFEEALEANSKSPQNTKQKEIRSLILAELAKIHLNLNQLTSSEKFANRALKLGKDKNFNQEDLLDLYIEMNPIFIRTGDLNKIAKNYRIMVKLAKRDKRKDLKAQVYFAYGKFLYGIQNNETESLKYLKKSQTLFQILNLDKAYDEATKFIEDIEKKTDSLKQDLENINKT